MRRLAAFLFAVCLIAGLDIHAQTPIRAPMALRSPSQEQTGTRTGTSQNSHGKLKLNEFKLLILWCPEGDLNPHGLAACGF